jgi:hypothetical protein
MSLFKTLSVTLDKQIRMREIDEDINRLRSRTKINNNFYHNHNKNIVQLDEKYYKNISKSSNSSASFNCYFIQEIEEYLLPDLVTDRSNSHKLTILRKELIGRYADLPE